MYSWCIKIFAGIHWNYEISHQYLRCVKCCTISSWNTTTKKTNFFKWCIISNLECRLSNSILNEETTVKWRQLLNNTKTIKSKQWVDKVQIQCKSEKCCQSAWRPLFCQKNAVTLIKSGKLLKLHNLYKINYWYKKNVTTITLQTEISATTVYSLNVLVPIKWYTVWPLHVNREVPSGITPWPWVDL